MRAYGVTTVIDLRSTSETIKSPSPYAEDSAAAYIHRELVDDANMNNIGDSESMFERYLFIVNNRPHAFGDVFNALAESEGAVLFHCFAGKDRTGLVAAMLLALSDVPPEHIAADYGETDAQLAKQYDVWVAEAPAEKRDAFREELRCPPERILGVLEHIQTKWGGVEGYLEAAGMKASSIVRLGAKLA